MKITYLHHSGFLIETEELQILIDYYEGDKKLPLSAVINEKKPLYVLVTHEHEDHFDKQIFDIENKYTTFIMSELCKNEMEIPDIHNLYFTKKGSEYKDDYISIKAYGSTDTGVSYYIETDDKKIFHAGDLNNWHWNEDPDTSKEESQEYIDFYKRELTDITDDIKELDIVMYPVDSRLGTDYKLGAIEFVSQIQVKHFFPMHMQEDFKKGNAMEELAEQYNFKHHRIENSNETFTI